MYDEKILYERLKYFEGYRSAPYRCVANRLTIGYGHTGDVRLTDRVDRKSAHELLASDCTRIDKMLRSVGIDLPVYKQTALVEFVFNVGFTAFKNSRIYNFVINYCQEYDGIICQLLKSWIHYHDKEGNVHVSHSLAERRKFDIEMWNK